MFGSSKNGASAYARVGLETGVIAASPLELIVMLFEGAMAAVTTALGHMKAGETEKKGKAISKAILIIQDGMRASLDQEAGGEIAGSLDALYDYMVRRLLQANLNNSPDMLDEVQTMLADLKSAWEAIGSQDPSAALQRARPPAADTAAQTMKPAGA